MSLRILLVVLPTLALMGCSRILADNTMDMAENVEPLFTKQVLINLSRTIDNQFAIPSQIDISAGTIQTSGSISPSLGIPLGVGVVSAFGTALTTTVSQAAVTGTIGTNAGWQQNWNVTPVSNANALRNLRALYRFAIWGSEENLRQEFHINRVTQGGRAAFDEYALLKPHCVFCLEEPPKDNTKLLAMKDSELMERLSRNPALEGGWLRWTDQISLAPSPLPLPEQKFLGRYGRYNLWMAKDAYDGVSYPTSCSS